MANQEHLAILRQGVEQWKLWRGDHEVVRPDLHEADLREADLGNANLAWTILSGADLSGANLSRAHLGNANLSGANLSGAHLSRAYLRYADLSQAYLTEADLREADLRETNLSWANLREANLSSADLREADLRYADLTGVDLTGVDLNHTLFTTIDLRTVKGLDTVRHYGPSEIGIGTLYLSQGKIPEVFLRGCGVPDSLIEYLPSLLGAMQPIQFYSCFISYSSKDEDFARRLHQRMRAEHLRVWFAPEDIKGGEKLHEQIERAIQMHDRLLLILSEESIRSEWVQQELRRARRAELASGRRKLFPIRLLDFEALQDWECPDSRTGSDLAEEVRQYFIPDFSDWKDHDAFERAFARLLRDLKAVDALPVPAPAPAQLQVSTPQITVLSPADISGQQAYLATHRRTLASYLQRLSILTTAHAPPEITHGIDEARASIARVKAILRASGVKVPDHPDDAAD
jgi:uncharacterized protein YjbI with pentapeptide repeats